jgi:aminopeptidase
MASSVMTSFDLVRLMSVVFHPKPGERVAVLIDLEDLDDIRGQRFLHDPKLVTQRIAWEVFYEGLLAAKDELPFSRVGFYAYEPTGGSNLDLPDTVVNLDGNRLRLVEDVLRDLDIVLYLSTYSATAPITAIAKKMGFRGATMHGCNEKILETGLAKNYDEVSAKAERFRQALTRCDDVVVEFETLGKRYRLQLDLGRQEAQKSHGLCRTPGEIANLPAGEIYWVPTGAHGQFPMKFKEDGTIAVMDVDGCRIRNATLLQGNAGTVAEALARYQGDPATGELGELGLGTQDLPFAGTDIQDEKVLGTFHVATGRSDHLGGALTPDKFRHKKNATHEDILFAPHKTPEINVTGVWMHKDGRETLLIENYRPTAFARKVAL